MNRSYLQIIRSKSNKRTLFFCSYKDLSVTDKEINQLISYNNTDINRHVGNCHLSIIKLKVQRGEIFKKAIKSNSLNDCETLLISGYADFIASYLNNELRKNYEKRNEAYMLYEYLLNKSLKKVISQNNSVVYVMYQCGDDEEKLYSWYENRIGESVQFPNFLSSSKMKWRGFGFYLEIKTSCKSSGKYIAPLTNKKTLEEEVTFMSNSKFKIDKVDRNKKTIFLSELSYTIQANYLLLDLYYLNIRNKEEVVDCWL